MYLVASRLIGYLHINCRKKCVLRSILVSEVLCSLRVTGEVLGRQNQASHLNSGLAKVAKSKNTFPCKFSRESYPRRSEKD